MKLNYGYNLVFSSCISLKSTKENYAGKKNILKASKTVQAIFTSDSYSYKAHKNRIHMEFLLLSVVGDYVEEVLGTCTMPFFFIKSLVRSKE